MFLYAVALLATLVAMRTDDYISGRVRVRSDPVAGPYLADSGQAIPFWRAMGYLRAVAALCAWLLLQEEATRLAWAAVPALGIATSFDFATDPVMDRGAPVPPEQLLVIRDNGLTEVEPGTTTARVRVIAD